MLAIGEKIKELRKKKGKTLEGLAKEANCSKSYVWALENSKSAPNPTTEKLAGIASALGVTIEYLIDDVSPEEDAKDKLFYRRYRNMNPEDKKKLQAWIEMWDEDT